MLDKKKSKSQLVGLFSALVWEQTINKTLEQPAPTFSGVSKQIYLSEGEILSLNRCYQPLLQVVQLQPLDGHFGRVRTKVATISRRLAIALLRRVPSLWLAITLRRLAVSLLGLAIARALNSRGNRGLHSALGRPQEPATADFDEKLHARNVSENRTESATDAKKTRKRGGIENRVGKRTVCGMNWHIQFKQNILCCPAMSPPSLQLGVVQSLSGETWKKKKKTKEAHKAACCRLPHDVSGKIVVSLRQKAHAFVLASADRVQWADDFLHGKARNVLACVSVSFSIEPVPA
jgi:hypothetical protein